MRAVTAVVLVGLSHSIGWGVRGNWGHEYGAMIPGALSALALCVVLPRREIREKAAYIGFAGAIGWSLGGSMSYGQLIGMTGSASSSEAAYGFAMLGVIGFLWALVGGAAVALAIHWPRARVASFVAPLCWVFAAWAGLDLAFSLFPADAEARVAWWGTDWLGVLMALAALVSYRARTGRGDRASELMLWMATGWWIGFLVLVVGLGLHMTPPRSDNWAGSVGLGAGLIVWLYRQQERTVLRAALTTGAAGALGFMLGQAVAVIGRSLAPELNWWSVMEQTFGFIAGAGLLLATRHPAADGSTTGEAETSPPEPGWTYGFAVGFLVLAVPWLNIRKNPATIWLRNQVVPERMGPLSIDTWLTLAFALVATVVVLAIRAHLRRGLEVVPASALGRAQALYLLLLWVVVVGNLSRYLPFPPGRLLTEGVIHANACLVSALVLLAPWRRHASA